MSVPFFPPLSYLIFLALLSLIFFITWSDFKLFRSREIKMATDDLLQSIDAVFMNPVIYAYLNILLLHSVNNILNRSNGSLYLKTSKTNFLL